MTTPPNPAPVCVKSPIVHGLAPTRRSGLTSRVSNLSFAASFEIEGKRKLPVQVSA
jgi:hypothetical protein